MAVTVEEALRLIEEAEERLKQARAALAPMMTSKRFEWPGGKILAEILAAGGSVTREHLYSLAAKHGMDRRGLGGFFRTSGKGSLYEGPGMDRVILTPSGIEIARRLLEAEGGVTYQVSESAFARVAERSFAEDWNSEEDSIYDEG